MPKINKTRKEQLHHDRLQAWNYRGLHDFSNDFEVTGILAGDNWVCSNTSGVTVGDQKLYFGDMVLALIDNPGEISKTNVDAGKWKIFRNAGTHGGVMVSEAEFTVVTDPLDPTYNYNTTTKILTIHALDSDFFNLTDNVNIYINSNKYTYRQFALINNTNQIWWKVSSAGFDIEAGDFVEVEVFRK